MIKSIQSLRGIAAILIFYHHFGFENVFAESFGDFGVAFFMTLSGFVVTLAYGERFRADAHSGDDAKHPALRFMLSRLIKIYPLYLLCWLLAVAFLPYRGSREGIALSLVMLQSWVPEADVYFAGNGVAWFISDLMFCYLLFVPLMRFTGRWPRLAAILAGVYFIGYFSVVLTVPQSMVHGIVYISPLMQLSSFIIGMGLCGLYRKIGESAWAERIGGRCGLVAINVAELAAIALVITAMWNYDNVPQRYSFASYWWVAVALVIIVFSVTDRHPGVLGRLLHLPPLLRLGDISFSFYLLHMLAIRAWRALMEATGVRTESFPLLLQSVAVIAILCCLSYLVRRYFDLPAGKWLRNLLFR